ncbi:calponin homology domain-containing protein [Gaertneriomyces semiglobifer]|nr:calponin homology domain-containing protein [Gaertneriomyces semiglobifer]
MARQYQDVSLHAPPDHQGNLEREVEAFSEHIRNLFADVPALKPKYIPINKDNFFDNLQDGVLLGHIINSIKPNLVNVAKLSTGIDRSHLVPPTKADESIPQEHTKDYFEATSNLNTCMDAAKKVAVVVNVAAEDFLAKKPDLVLGVIWQLIRAYLLSDVNVPSHPELIRLLQPGESLTTLINLTNEQLLLRWFNYHLARSGKSKRVNNLGKDIADAEAYLLLLRQVAPGHKEEVLADLDAAIKLADKEAKAKATLEVAEKLGCRKFVTAADILAGAQRLNLGFVATIFSKHIGIVLPTEEESRATVDKLAALDEERVKLLRRIAELEARVTELEGELASEKAQHNANTSSLEKELEAVRALKQEESQTLNTAIADLQRRLESVQSEKAKTEDGETAFKQSISNHLGGVREMLKDHMTAMKYDADLAATLGRLLGANVALTPAKEDLPPLPAKQPSTMEEELECLSEELQAFVKQVLEENAQQKKLIFALATRADQNDKV